MFYRKEKEQTNTELFEDICQNFIKEPHHDFIKDEPDFSIPVLNTEAIKFLMEQNGLDILHLSSLLKASPTAVRKILAGKDIKRPEVVFVKLPQALNVDLDAILSDQLINLEQLLQKARAIFSERASEKQSATI